MWAKWYNWDVTLEVLGEIALTKNRESLFPSFGDTLLSALCVTVYELQLQLGSICLQNVQ